jgi:hypothetical protein
VGGCSATLTELGRELCWRENRNVVAEDEQVLVAGHQVRPLPDREGEQVVVVGVAGADRRWAWRILGEDCVVADPVGERGGLLRSDRLEAVSSGIR